MTLTKKRWFVLAASCFVNLCIGSLYAWSVFATPEAEYLKSLTGKAVSNIALVFTVANSVGPITMIGGGFVNDRLGPKWVVLIGGLMFGLGMILSGYAKSFGILMFSYGILVGLGVGMVYGCTVSNAVKFFPDRRGLAGGLATASYGISSVLVPPVANALIAGLGVSASFRILGLAMLLVICVSALFIKACPQGFCPEGWTPSASSGGRTGTDQDWRGMLSDKIFYVMILMLLCGAFSGLTAVSQASPIAQRMIGMNPAAAALAVSILALFNAAGRILSGIISDRIGYVRTFLGVFAAAVVALLLLFSCAEGTILRFYLGISLLGFCFGSFMGVYPSFTARQYGAKNNSVNYGIMFIGFAVAGYFGPTIMAAVYNRSGSYKNAFLIAIGLSVLGFALTLLYGRKNRNA